MINIVIIEDELPAQLKLLDTLQQMPFEVNVNAKLGTVKEGIEYFASNPPVNLVLSDVQLPDGQSFDIFRNISARMPVIFITGFDQFMLYAFESNGIDYLLKPVERDDLQKSLLKYKMLEDHFSQQSRHLQNLLEFTHPKKKTRLIVKKGIENISIRMEDIVLFYTESKIVYLFDNQGRKFMVDKPLNDLECCLDTSIFFRANRQYIINLNFVRCFKPYEKVKLLVDLNLCERNHSIIISQVTAPFFRKWISEV